MPFRFGFVRTRPQKIELQQLHVLPDQRFGDPDEKWGVEHAEKMWAPEAGSFVPGIAVRFARTHVQSDGANLGKRVVR